MFIKNSAQKVFAYVSTYLKGKRCYIIICHPSIHQRLNYAAERRSIGSHVFPMSIISIAVHLMCFSCQNIVRYFTDPFMCGAELQLPVPCDSYQLRKNAGCALWRHDLWLASICDCGTICDHIMLQFVTRHDLWPKVLQFVTSVIQWF